MSSEATTTRNCSYARVDEGVVYSVDLLALVHSGRNARISVPILLQPCVSVAIIRRG